MLREIPLPETAMKTWRRQAPPAVTRIISSVDPDKVYMRAFRRISWHFFCSRKNKKCNPCKPALSEVSSLLA